MTKTNAKKVGIDKIDLYEGDWKDGDFVITRHLRRSDLTTPSIKPAFVVYLTSGDAILVGWTTKGATRLFFIKDFIHDIIDNTNINSLPGFKSITLKIIRMRGSQWQKTTKIVKRGMAKWFQNEPASINFDSFSMPKFKSVTMPLYANDMVSVQPMTSQANLLFNINYKVPASFPVAQISL